MGAESLPDHPGPLVLHLTIGSYSDLIWPFKASLHEFDLALMVGLTGSAHRPNRLECIQRALMEKLGGGTTSPWCCTGEERVVQLLCCCCHPPQNKIRVSQVDIQEPSDEA